MSKKSIKILSAILMIVVLVCSVSNIVFALEPNAINSTPDDDVTKSITNVGNTIIGVLKVAGVVVSVIMLMILGFKYMMGSAEDKAEYKKSMIPYLVGAICIFAAPFIAQAVYDLASSIKSD